MHFSLPHDRCSSEALEPHLQPTPFTLLTVLMGGIPYWENRFRLSSSSYAFQHVRYFTMYMTQNFPVHN